MSKEKVQKFFQQLREGATEEVLDEINRLQNFHEKMQYDFVTLEKAYREIERDWLQEADNDEEKKEFIRKTVNEIIEIFRS